MDLRARVDRVVDTAIAENRVAGSVTMVARHGELIYARAAGFADRAAGKPMTLDTIFRLASVSKPIVSAAALAMVERGLIGLENSVSDHLPWFRPKLADGSEARITVRHLLTHTSGLPVETPPDPVFVTALVNTDLTLEENFSRLALMPLVFEPGTGWLYGFSTDVLGAVVEAIHGSTLADAVEHYVTGPLGMVDTGFEVTDLERLATPYTDNPPELRPMADPERVVSLAGDAYVFSPSRMLNPRAFQSAGAGMAGTAGDVFKFLETLRVGGGPILRPETVEMATLNQIGDIPREDVHAGQRFGFLSAVVVDPVAAQSPYAAGTFRWGGVYGHDWSVDPVNGITILSMTNTALEPCVGQYPKDIRDAVYR